MARRQLRNFGLTLLLFLAACAPCGSAAEPVPVDLPRASDPRLEVIRFAASPEIVHPINLTFDARGRLLVIESHTHFRPANYTGPPHDRVRLIEDTNGDGSADRFSTFFEGTTFTMDIATHADGSIYLATRSEILRLRDTDGNGTADEKQQIVKLETAGNYPHNGLSGLAFDFHGNLLFGLGENLGASYRLIGSDGATIADQGEGGNVFWCTADGKGLRRVATGFWNPFGVTIDIFGRVWAVDNDPDATPPCRLLHVVEGGDYGYQFRYGRSGRHPFQAWNGQLPGTLPMASGTGEAPCEVLSYESDGLPAEYLGNLLVTSWADHRIERYTFRPRGASYQAERHPFVQGGSEFRPVGLAVAPDGSLFASDWVRRDYNLHNQGALWHIRSRKHVEPSRPSDTRQALASLHRPLREAAARKLIADDEGRDFLAKQLDSEDVRRRATALEALARVPDYRERVRTLADQDSEPALRAHAVELLVRKEEPQPSWFAPSALAPVRLAAIPALHRSTDLATLLKLLDDDDPFLRSAAVRQLGDFWQLSRSIADISQLTPRQRRGVLLAQRAAGHERSQEVARWLADPDEEVRFLAVKWIADRGLGGLRQQLAETLNERRLDVRMYVAYATALNRIDRLEISDQKLADYFVELLFDRRTPPERLILALRMVPATHKRLSVDLLHRLLESNDRALQLEAVRKLAGHPDERRFDVLKEILRGIRFSDQLRAETLVGMAARSKPATDLWMEYLGSANPAVRNEALRGLTGESIDGDTRSKLMALAEREPETKPLVARVLGEPASGARPPHADIAAWLEKLAGPADADAGRRVFFHPKLAGCFRCHRVDGHGEDIGPDLSVIGRTERRHMLESILQPNNLVPPHYQAWQLVLEDGRTLTGMLLRTHLDEYTYVDPQGKQFQVRTGDIADSQPAQASIMPSGMVDRLTDQELRDLLAFLSSRQ